MSDEAKTSGSAQNDKLGNEAPTLHTPKRSYRIRPAFIIAIIFSVVSVYFLSIEVHNRIAFINEEDARIHADLTTISSRVAGWITKIPAVEGEKIIAGTVLIQVDNRESRILVSELEAQAAGLNAERSRLAAERILVASQIASRLVSEQSRVSAAKVVVSSLRPQRGLAERELNRAKNLYANKVTSRRQLDQAETKYQQTDREYRISLADLQAAKSRIKEAEADRARLGVLAADVIVLEQRVSETRARIERQRLDVTDRAVKSPINGVIDKTFVNVGEYVTPGQRLLLVHNPAGIWVEANVKETVVSKLSVGQSVNIHVDAYPDEAFIGTVANIGSAATSQFALLPTPNPSGNFTKITQRMPIRITIEKPDPRLRPGMMVEVKIAIEE
ncbi:MAG: HlyD family secretion protein [Pseudomonadales bacterium]|jgi:membrane fusion protein (multidrug efflux system)|tara:strand:- start:911 stop:2074 length:1164 start_codon:yes stop_codon:yes gene_type:complete